MLCDKCKKNNATTHIRSVVNGVVAEHNLCGYCAASTGYNDMAGAGLTGMLSSMFSQALSSGVNTSVSRCPVCGSAFSDIAESGRAGCSACYETFYSEWLPYLKRVHGSTKHAGRTPQGEKLVVKPALETVDELRMRLARLVSEEKYEQAAIIRDKIKQIEEEKE